MIFMSNPRSELSVVQHRGDYNSSIQPVFSFSRGLTAYGAELMWGKKLHGSSTAEEWSFSATFSGRGQTSRLEIRVPGRVCLDWASGCYRAIGLSGYRAQEQGFHMARATVLTELLRGNTWSAKDPFTLCSRHRSSG
jgi:hypothetical protein